MSGENPDVTSDGRYLVRKGPGGTRLAGHALAIEGRKPAIWGGAMTTWRVHCECGATREVASAAAAKRWHAKHKGDVASGGAR